MRFVQTLLPALGLLLLFSVPALAAIGIDPDLRPEYAPGSRAEIENSNYTPETKYGTSAISMIIADIALVLIQISGVIAIYFIVNSGLTYVKAFGRDEELQKAKKSMIWALVGLIVIISAYAIVQNIIRITLTVDESQL